MRLVTAGLVVATLAVAGTAPLLLPPWAAGLALAVALLALRRGRPTFLAMTLVGAALNALLFAVLMSGPGPVVAGITLSAAGAQAGLLGALRLAASLGASLALLSWIPAERVLDGLRLPPAATALLAAVVATAHDVGRDFARLKQAARLDGAWPRGPWRRTLASARLLPPLVVLALRHAQVRRDALRLAGHDTAPRFAALVAVAGLAAAGRMAMLAVPNDPVTYAVVFLGGLLFGPLVGALAGLLAMALTNLLISGLQPVAFANVPAMALLGLLGAGLGRLHAGNASRATTTLLAAAAGAVGVLLFSVAADAATWALVPEHRATPGALRLLVASGLAFNLVPAAAAAAVFALAVGPVVRAVEAAGLRHVPHGSRRAQGVPDATRST